MKRKNMEGIPATGRRDNGMHHAEKVAAAALRPHDVTIYDNNIELYADEYIQTLPEDRQNKVYGDVYAVSGMMQYIYKHVFMPHETLLYNSNTVIDTSDVRLLNHVWEDYASICYRYGVMPTIYRFCKMTGISVDTINTWMNGTIRNASKAHSELAKSWKAECEAALCDAGGNQTVKSIFLLKSKYGYVETQQPVQIVNPLAPKMTAEQLEDLIDKDTPQLPDD